MAIKMRIIFEKHNILSELDSFGEEYFYIVDENNMRVNNEDGNCMYFSSYEDAEEYTMKLEWK